MLRLQIESPFRPKKPLTCTQCSPLFLKCRIAAAPVFRWFEYGLNHRGNIKITMKIKLEILLDMHFETSLAVWFILTFLKNWGRMALVRGIRSLIPILRLALRQLERDSNDQPENLSPRHLDPPSSSAL